MTDDLTPAPIHEVPSTAGQWLRQARTRQGLHLAMLSVALKVPVRTLELLETDRHEELPGPTFVRALASSVCRHLRLDPAEVLALLPQREQHMAAPPASLEAAVPAHRTSRRWRLDRTQLVYIALAFGMVLVIAGLLWWPSPSTAPSPPEPAVSFMPPPEAVTSPASSPEAMPEPSTAGPATSTAEVLPAVAPAPAGRVAAVMAVPVSGSTSLPGPSSAPSSPPALRLAASGESWVEVRSDDEQVLFSQVLQAGQVHEIRHPGPLRVVLGRAAVMQVQVKGQNFDLAPHTKVTVARFEVRP